MFSLKIYSGPKVTVPFLPRWLEVQAHCQKYFCILLRAGLLTSPSLTQLSLSCPPGASLPGTIFGTFPSAGGHLMERRMGYQSPS